MPTVERRYLLDANVMIYASLANDPRCEPARHAIEQGRRPECAAFLSVQNLAELYPNLTGPKTVPSDTPAEASEKIRHLASLSYVQVMPVSLAVIQLALELAERYQVRCQKFFDMQLAATLILHDISTLVTEDAVDLAPIPEIRVLDPFV